LELFVEALQGAVLPLLNNWVTNAVVVINRTRLPWLQAAKPKALAK